MELAEKNYLISKIKQLYQKRQMHQKIIQNLLGAKQSTATAESEQANLRFSALNAICGVSKKDVQAQLHNTDRSNTSHLSSLSRQVNLQMYLHTKQQTDSDSATCSSVGQNNLECSLKQIYGSNIRYKFAPTADISNKISAIHQSSHFYIIAQFMTRKQLWEEVFVCKDDLFQAAICCEFNSSTQQLINLSSDKILQKQLHLVYSLDKKQSQIQLQYQESEQSQLQQNSNTIFIGYLLLNRLINRLKVDSVPKILQIIFGFPYQIFNLHVTQEYFAFEKIIKQADNKQLIVIAENLINSRYQFVDISKQKYILGPKFVEKYGMVAVVNTLPYLSSKKLDVIHRRNHHLVIDLQNSNEYQVQIYLTFVSKSDKQSHLQQQTQLQARKDKISSTFSSKCSINKKINNSQQQKLFRYCLLNEQGQIIQYSSPYQKSNQSIRFAMKAQSELKLYASQISFDELNINNSITSDLQQFSVVVQSQKSIKNLSLQVKFNQDYNIMTQTLMNKYLKNYGNVDQVQKQMIRLSQDYSQIDILIVRVNFKLMGLIADFICLQQNVRANINANTRKLYIQYQQKQVLCDKHYRENKKKITYQQPQIYQIYLSKKSKIRHFSGFNFVISQIFM